MTNNNSNLNFVASTLQTLCDKNGLGVTVTIDEKGNSDCDSALHVEQHSNDHLRVTFGASLVADYLSYERPYPYEGDMRDELRGALGGLGLVVEDMNRWSVYIIPA
tara:strand:+ start:152 stop:469 length:318 start_codon:yes stop_codon:yes gene_type:complete